MNATARTAGPGTNPDKNATTTGPARAESPEGMTRLLLRIPSLSINGGRIQFLDETTKTPFSREASGLTLTVKDLNTAETYIVNKVHADLMAKGYVPDFEIISEKMKT